MEKSAKTLVFLYNNFSALFLTFLFQYFIRFSFTEYLNFCSSIIKLKLYLRQRKSFSARECAPKTIPWLNARPSSSQSATHFFARKILKIKTNAYVILSLRDTRFTLLCKLSYDHSNTSDHFLKYSPKITEDVRRYWGRGRRQRGKCKPYFGLGIECNTNCVGVNLNGSFFNLNECIEICY